MQRFFYDPDAMPFPSGKLTVNNERRPIKKQSSISCLLKTMRRIAYFDNAHHPLIPAYKEIKSAIDSIDALAMNNEDVLSKLFQIGNKICETYNIDLKSCALEDKDFLINYKHERKSNSSLSPKVFFEDLPIYKKSMLLYSVLLEKILMPLMNVRNSNWNPFHENGFEELRESVKINGPHLFIGKFGASFNLSPPNIYKPESTPDRIVRTYDKTSFFDAPNTIQHWIMIDKVAMVQGKINGSITGVPMIFYRDSNDNSSPGSSESVYMMTYASFVTRLTDRMGYRCDKVLHDNEASFGVMSNNISKFF